jgi:hypothetical protein
MRTAPPLQVELIHQGLWRAGLSLLLSIVLISMGAWWLSQPRPVPGWATLSTVASAAGAIVCLLPLAWPRPVTLRWDGEAWHFVRSDGAWSGRLAVAVDLGAWMLLRFTADDAMPGRATAWIPAQRRGLETYWHALRCAVYSPRPTRAARTDG